MAEPTNPLQGSAASDLFYGLGNIAGGISQIQSGGRLPNVAGQMQQADIERRIQAAQLQAQQERAGMEKEKMQMEKLKTGWELVKDIRNVIDTNDEEAVTKAANLISDRMGDPAFGELAKRAIKDEGFSNVVTQTFPHAYKKFGKQALEMYKNPKFHDELKATEKKLSSENAFNTTIDLLDRGVINKHADMADIAKIIPGFMDLDDQKLMMLNQKGMSKVKSTRVAETEARAKIETVSQERLAAHRDRRDERLEARDEVRDQQWRTSLDAMDRRHAQSLAALTERSNRLSTDQMRLLNNFDEADRVIDDIKKTHAKAFPKGGTISAALKGAILESNKARTVREAFIPESTKGLTDAERDWVAAHNMLAASLYKLTDERQLSEIEGLRNLKSFDPAVSTEQYQKNAASRQDSVRRQRANWEAMLTGSGRKVTDRPGNPTDKPASSGPSQAEIDAAKKRLGIK